MYDKRYNLSPVIAFQIPLLTVWFHCKCHWIPYITWISFFQKIVSASLLDIHTLLGSNGNTQVITFCIVKTRDSFQNINRVLHIFAERRGSLTCKVSFKYNRFYWEIFHNSLHFNVGSRHIAQLTLKRDFSSPFQRCYLYFNFGMFFFCSINYELASFQ